MNSLLLHDSTRETLSALTKQPPQGLLLVGPEGIGKRTLASLWAQQICNQSTDIRVISPDDKGTISIEAVRDLYQTTRAKQDGRQAIIVERADRMSIEAENAFLKLLEEPRQGLTFILTSLRLESLLPTVRSRIQHIKLRPVADSAIRSLIMSKNPGIAQGDLAQIVFLAQGRPGVATTLLDDSSSLPKQRERMQLAKHLVSAKPYDRYSQINKIATSRDECLATLDAMTRITEVQISSATSATALQQWAQIATALEEAQNAIANNGNVKAQLLRLFIQY